MSTEDVTDYSSHTHTHTYIYIYIYILVTGVAQWLRHCATSRKVLGSNLGGVGRRDFSRSYRQNHVPWGRLRL